MVGLLLIYWAVAVFIICFILYHIIRTAVKNGVKEALYELERERQ